MKILHVFILCCLAAVRSASDVMEVKGHVGGDVSINCSGSWTTDHNELVFCKGPCSGQSVVIQSERNTPTVTRGRYRLEASGEHGVFYVTIQRLKRADAGKYSCGAEEPFHGLHQDVRLTVLHARTLPPGPPTATIPSLQTRALSQGSSVSSTEPAALTSPATERTEQQAATSLTDTTVVIIVSVSLALLVCAVIPLIFYGHWRSSAGAQSSREQRKGETSVRLQALEPAADPEPSAPDSPQYAAVYQALDPKSLD